MTARTISTAELLVRAALIEILRSQTLLTSDGTAPGTVEDWRLQSLIALQERYGERAYSKRQQARAILALDPPLAFALLLCGLDKHPAIVMRLAEA